MLCVTEEMPSDIVAQTILDASGYINQQHNTLPATFQQNIIRLHTLVETYGPELGFEPSISSHVLCRVGGAMLTLSAARYGADAMHPKMYSGTAEKQVISTYHHAKHSFEFTEGMFQYAVERNRREPGTFSEAMVLRSLIIGPTHDIVIGNGRGTDEHLSAQIGSNMLRVVGLLENDDEAVMAATEATAWNEIAKRQAYDAKRAFFPLQQGACVADLRHLLDKRGPNRTATLAPEDFSKNMHNNILNTEAAANGVSLLGASALDCMRLMDESPVLYKKFVDWSSQQGAFYRDYVPADPGLLQKYGQALEDNADFMDRTHHDLAAGWINVEGFYNRTLDYQSS